MNAPRRLKHCKFHITGVPAYVMGQRFYCPGCVECERKRANGLVGPGDPTTEEMKAAHFRRLGIKSRRVAA